MSTQSLATAPLSLDQPGPIPDTAATPSRAGLNRPGPDVPPRPARTRYLATREAANWAWSLRHLIPGYETMQPLELEQCILDQIRAPRGATVGRRR